MDSNAAAVRTPRRPAALATQGLGLAATAVMLAATMVIVFAAPI